MGVGRKVERLVGERMEEMVGREYCSKCGIETFPFSKKYSVSASDYFCVKCAERTDKEYLIKNSCSVCKKLLKRNEVKLVLPSKIYSNQPLPLLDRLICSNCYQRIGTRSMDRRSFRHKMERIRANIRAGFMRKVMKQVSV